MSQNLGEAPELWVAGGTGSEGKVFLKVEHHSEISELESCFLPWEL